MLKSGIGLLALALALPALAQTAPVAPPASPEAAPAPGNMGPPPEFIQSAQAFGQCAGMRVKAADAKATPEAAASSALAACETERGKMETSFESWISSPSFPAEGREIARAQFKSEMAGVSAKIADDIRKERAKTSAK